MQKIVVFDSGIGGFSILQEIIKQHLPVSIDYLADQAYFPYGNKSSTWLNQRLTEIANAYQARRYEAFVLACNTGTVEGINAMRNLLPYPVVGVEPVIKPLSSYDHALILATPSAASSARTQELHQLYGPHLQVHGCQGLASAIENNDLDQMKKTLHEISTIILRENIQALGLSCTHYPLIEHELQQQFPHLHIYNPAPAVVLHLKELLRVESGVNLTNIPISFQTTGEVIRFKQQIKQYLGMDYPAQKVAI